MQLNNPIGHGNGDNEGNERENVNEGNGGY